jgi:hypothetical protein
VRRAEDLYDGVPADDQAGTVRATAAGDDGPDLSGMHATAVGAVVMPLSAYGGAGRWLAAHTGRAPRTLSSSGNRSTTLALTCPISYRQQFLGGDLHPAPEG